MNKTALVTGAVRGIGLEIVRQFAQRGLTVILSCRDVDRGRKAAASIPGDVQVLPMDVTSDESIHSAVQQFSAGHEVLDVLEFPGDCQTAPSMPRSMGTIWR